jgi:hypothetical protein
MKLMTSHEALHNLYKSCIRGAGQKGKIKKIKRKNKNSPKFLQHMIYMIQNKMKIAKLIHLNYEGLILVFNHILKVHKQTIVQ